MASCSSKRSLMPPSAQPARSGEWGWGGGVSSFNPAFTALADKDPISAMIMSLGELEGRAERSGAGQMTYGPTIERLKQRLAAVTPLNPNSLAGRGGGLGGGPVVRRVGRATEGEFVNKDQQAWEDRKKANEDRQLELEAKRLSNAQAGKQVELGDAQVRNLMDRLNRRDDLLNRFWQTVSTVLERIR